MTSDSRTEERGGSSLERMVRRRNTETQMNHWKYIVGGMNRHARTCDMRESMILAADDAVRATSIVNPACGSGNFLPELYVTPCHVLEFARAQLTPPNSKLRDGAPETPPLK